jgi:phage-related protein
MTILKKLEWIGSAKKDLQTFPESVKDEIGYALYRIQEGKTPHIAKYLNGMGSGIMELTSDYDTNTYRAVYVVNLGNKIYVLHCFQKKSKRGIETPKEEIERIKQRLKWLKAALNK